MNINLLSPYIRVAMHSCLVAPFEIKDRIIFDYELIFIENGCFLFTIDNKKIVCKKNDIILIHPNHPHKFESIDNINLSQPHIHFDFIYDDKSEQICVSYKNFKDLSDYERTLIRPDILSSLNIPPVFKIKNLTLFKTLFFDIIDTYQKKDKYFQIEYKQKMLNLIILLIEELIEVPNTQSYDFKREMINIKNFIDSNYHQNISLDNLSKQFHLNKFYMLRKFKAEFGETIINYYNKVRLNAAVGELLSTRSNISEISGNLGFENIYEFSRFFKNKTGYSPTKFRRLNEQPEET